jgi:hypothetical protein
VLVSIGNYWVDPKDVKSVHYYNDQSEWATKDGRNGWYVKVIMRDDRDNVCVRGDSEVADCFVKRINMHLASSNS